MPSTVLQLQKNWIKCVQNSRHVVKSPRYDGRGLNLSEEEVERRLAAGEPHVIRMKVPTEGVCKFNDMLRGEVEIPWAQVDMQILLKTDGLPTYHLGKRGR